MTPRPEAALWHPRVAAGMRPWFQSSKPGPQGLSPDPAPFPLVPYGPSAEGGCIHPSCSALTSTTVVSPSSLPTPTPSLSHPS